PTRRASDLVSLRLRRRRPGRQPISDRPQREETATVTILDEDRYRKLLEKRAADPAAVREAARARQSRPLLGDDGKLVIVAIDHPARRILGVGSDRRAMADRRVVLENTIRALRRPGVDGLLATPDILEDLLLLG